MRSSLAVGVRMTLAMTVLTGGIYPAIVTGLAQALFPRQAHGSLVERDGRVIGSALIAQGFTRPEYFHPRPSAAGAGYDAGASGGSNLGPTSRRLLARVRADAARYRAENGGYAGAIPADGVTTSASGLDPDISPANAAIQAARVAAARGVPVEDVRAMLARWTEPPWLGFIGEARVNVLRVNVALDAEFPRP